MPNITSGTDQAPQLANEASYMNMLAERRGSINSGYTTARILELSGAQIIEPTAFEPDASTFRGKYYYNAKTNTLYMRVVTRQEPGIVVAYWQKVSD